MLVCIDFETVSECDLKECGALVYSHHYSTEILCACWASVAGTMRGDWVPERGLDEQGKLWELAADPTVFFLAHNVSFEKSIWTNIMVHRYGFPEIPPERWRDTMAVCAMKCLPLALDKAAEALGLPVQKDKVASRFVVGLSKLPREKWPDDWQARAIAYCHQDVATEIALHNRIGLLPKGEREVWLLDQKINARGVKVDLAFVSQAQRIVRDAIAPLAKKFTDLTGVSHTQGEKFLAWLRWDQGVELPNLQKATIDTILRMDEHGEEPDDIDWETEQVELPPDAKIALQIRQLIASSSIKKLNKMELCTWLSVAYNLLQYHVAGTGRWAGRLLQPQNFPRGVGRNMDHVVSAIMTGDHRYVDAVIGPPVEVVVGALRHALVARPDKVLVVGDFAGIEARVVLALAGQHDKTELMASGHDVYIDMANQIYNRIDITKADIAERTIGKNTVLGCGFQMGWNKFKARYCPLQPDAFAQRVIETYRKEWAPDVPKLWYALQDAAVETVHDGQPHSAYGVEFQIEDGWLTTRLPSGRKLWYYDPRPVLVSVPWDDAILKRSYSYSAQKTGRWIRVKAYGGIITENVVQALARDLMVYAMFKCEEAGMPVILTVHDEIVCECDDTGQDWATMLQEIMEDRPQWAIDMKVPVAAECWQGDRYKK